jgi:uncharacterized membrane protein YoaK (UPF0700 family)
MVSDGGAPVGSATESAPPGTWRRQLLLILLAVTSGATDAIGFVALGNVFTSVMTGNMVLVGVGVATRHGSLVLNAAIAIVCFMAGALAGSRIARTPQPDDPLWPRPVTRALAVEFAIFAIFAAIWWGVGGHPAGAEQQVLLGTDAVALGIQSGAILRFGLSGISTTYMTGTLTTLVSALTNGKHPKNVLPSAQILVALTVGAAVAVLLVNYAVLLVPLMQLVPVGYVLASIAIHRGQLAGPDHGRTRENPTNPAMRKP